MDRYQRIERPKAETAINPNEVRVTTQGLIRNYVSYASSLLQDRSTPEIVLKAMGQAISKAVAIAEIIKRRVPTLHQVTSISSASITDVWEPIEEGLLPLETTRHVSMITITLSMKPLDTKAPGYQAPLPAENLKQRFAIAGEGGRGRGRGRGRARGWGLGWGGRGNYGGGYYNNVGWYVGWGRGRGRGRGIGRAGGGREVFRGRGRGRGRGMFGGRGRGMPANEAAA